jgi:hypothetical protein
MHCHVELSVKENETQRGDGKLERSEEPLKLEMPQPF